MSAQRVAAAAAVAGMGGQERAHVLLGDGLELAAELGVQRSDRGERVADEVGELHVDDAVRQPVRRSRARFMPRSQADDDLLARTAAAHSVIELSSDASRRRWLGRAR